MSVHVERGFGVGQSMYHRRGFLALAVAITFHVIIVGILYEVAPHWVIDTYRGPIDVKMTPRNDFLGITLPSQPGQGARPRISGLRGVPVPVAISDISPTGSINALPSPGDNALPGDELGNGSAESNGGTGIGEGGGDGGIIDLTSTVGAVLEKYPVTVREAKPEYPELARRLGVEGTVIVKLLIDRDGKPKDAEVFKSDNVLLNSAATAAAMKWLFTPAIMNNATVAVWATVPFRFRLTGK